MIVQCIEVRVAGAGGGGDDAAGRRRLLVLHDRPRWAVSHLRLRDVVPATPNDSVVPRWDDRRLIVSTRPSTTKTSSFLEASLRRFELALPSSLSDCLAALG